jgi:hypothetical protein
LTCSRAGAGTTPPTEGLELDCSFASGAGFGEQPLHTARSVTAATDRVSAVYQPSGHREKGYLRGEKGLFEGALGSSEGVWVNALAHMRGHNQPSNLSAPVVDSPPACRLLVGLWQVSVVVMVPAAAYQQLNKRHHQVKSTAMQKLRIVT